MIELSALAEPSLAELLDAAVADADPAEVMAPLPGERGWSARQRQAFLDFHRGRSIGTARPVETTYVIRRDGRVVGAARLQPHADGAVEAGIWLGRSARGGGAGRATFAELVALARCRGDARLVAETTVGNTAARALLTGFVTTVRDERVSAVLELSPPLRGAVVLITGIQAAGKSTVAEALASRLPHSAHVRGDAFRRMIVGGRAEMTPEPDEEALRQLRLRHRLAAGVADGYAAAGFTAVLQDVVLGDALPELAGMITARPLFLVVLAPDMDTVHARESARHKDSYDRWSIAGLHAVLTERTPRIGLWLDNSAQRPHETVRDILCRLPEAALT